MKNLKKYEITSMKNSELYQKLILWSCDKEDNVSSNYSIFLTTLAGFTLALSPYLFDFLKNSSNIFLKILFSLSLFIVFLSLISGMIYNMLKKKFYTNWSLRYYNLFKRWNDVKDEKDIEIVLEIEKEILKNNSTKCYQWPVILQTILLFLGIFMVSLIFIITLFDRNI